MNAVRRQSRERFKLPCAAWRGLAWGCLFIGFLVGRGGAQGSEHPTTLAERPVARKPGLLKLEECPKRFTPKTERTEADRDRIEAMAQFAAGRALEERQDYAAALRYYQRALRCDPEAATVARSVVRVLATELRRPAEAVRYALKIAELEDTDPSLLRQLGAYLTEEGQWRRAATLYERSLLLSDRKVEADASQRVGAEILVRTELGRIYCLLGEYARAADHFDRVVYVLDHPRQFALPPRIRAALLAQPSVVHRLMGEAFLMADRPAEAVAAFSKANASSPDAGVLAYQTARGQARQGKVEDALAELQSYFDQRRSEEGIGPYELLAQLLEKLGRKGDLIERLEALRRADPDNAPLCYFLAEQRARAGQFDKAEPLYRKALGEKPTAAAYGRLLALYRKTGRQDAMLDVLAEMVDKSGSLASLGQEDSAAWKDPALAKRLIQVARDRRAASPEEFGFGASLATALVATASKQFDAAGEFFDLAIQAKPKAAAELLMTWGLGLMLEDRMAEAARVFERGVAQGGSPAEQAAFSYYLAGALEMSGRTGEALDAARRAAEADKTSAQFASRAAWVLYHAKRFPEASKAYRRLIERFDGNHDSSEVREAMREARFVLSALAVEQGKTDEAEEWLQQVVDEFPDDAGALNDLGYLWTDEGRHLERSLGMLKRAVEAEPTSAAYRDSLGWALYRLGRHQEAVAELEKAAVGERPDPVVLDHLGDAYLKAGKPDKASALWRRAAEGFGKAGEAAKLKAVEAKLKTLRSG